MGRKNMLFVLLFIVLTGCKTEENVRPMQLAQQAIVDQYVADEAKQIVLSMEEVVEVKGVVVDQDVYVAPRVKHFARLWLKEIREQSHHSLSKRFPEKNVHLSTDKKVYMELEKLEKQLQKKEISEKRLKEKVTKIEEMMKG